MSPAMSPALKCVICSVVAAPLDPQAEMHLQPQPLFHLPSDNVGMTCVHGTEEGRIFLGGRDGCLYEVTYQAKEGWFRGKCQLINHSTSLLSYLLPAFLSFTEEGTVLCVLCECVTCFLVGLSSRPLDAVGGRQLPANSLLT